MKAMKLTLILGSLFIFLMSFSPVSAQLKINSSGNIELEGASSTIVSLNGTPFTFKVSNVLAGFTGGSSNSNMSFGYSALRNSLAGYHNTAVGYSALSNNATGTSNTAVGYSALSTNTTGTYNTANGFNSLRLNTGSANTATGSTSLEFNLSGSNNTANGSAALYQNTTGNGNTAIGCNALNPNTTGSYNTAIGSVALFSNTKGSYNVAIGYYAGAENPDSLSNSIAIGYAAMVTGSHQVIIGNSGIGKIGGWVNWSNVSDERVKKNIKADVPGLNFINGLQPVTYNLDLDAADNLLGIDKEKKEKRDKDMTQDLKDKNDKARKDKENIVQTGFVAQDVEKTAKNIGYNFSGVNVDESGIYSLSYSEFVVPLVKAVQELSEQNARQQELIDKLNARIEQLEKRRKL